MNEPIEIPSRALKIWVAVTGGLFWFLVAAWLCFFAVWGALHGWIVPRIADFRPRIEAEASKALGVPVRIGQISARSEGLVPSFTLGDVALLDAEGRTALRLPQVVVALSPRSLWNHGFEQLYLDAPELDVRRAADGRILVAGIALSTEHTGGDNAAADWLFSQTEVVVKNGTVRWTDEQRGAAPLALSQVDIVLRNRPWRHALRVDATPPPDWGTRFSAMGRFRQPLLAGGNGRWQDWVGQGYADFAQVDVSQLRQHVDLSQFGVDVASGRGALRAWADVRQRRVAGGVVDLALEAVQVRAAPDLQPLALQRLQGRLSGSYSDAKLSLAAQGLQFDTDDGTHWPLGDAALNYTQATPRRGAQGELQADRIDLAVLAHIGERLPLAESLRQALAAHAPRGQIENLQGRWEGDANAPSSYQVRGRAVGLAVAAQPAPASAVAPAAPGGHVHPPTGTPGLSGASVDFDFNQAGGTAQLAMDDGMLEFPGIFEEPTVPVDKLRADLRWTLAGSRITVEVPSLSFANDDAAGEAHASWHSAAGEGAARFPGVLDLTGSLQRADGTRVHRYLPQVIPPDVRHYVRDAVQAGRANGVQFRVRGDLLHMPFADPRQGDFRIAAQIRDATFAYVPTTHQPAGEAPWPALAPLTAELVFERNSMEIRNATGRIGLPGKPGELQVQQANARIADLAHSVVEVSAAARGPLAEMLAVVSGSPIGGLIGSDATFLHASVTGPADLKLNLSLPLATMHQSRVQGSVQLAGNDLRFTPDSLLLARTRGTVAFTESGFSVSGIQVSTLGGDARIDGGMRVATATAPAMPMSMRMQGTVSAAGLREATELGFVSRLAAHASGSTSYSATLGTPDNRVEIQLSSSLQGLGLDLPAPLGKAADAAMPLRYHNHALAPERGAARDQVVLDLGSAVALRYERDVSGAVPRVLRGSIGIGLAADEQPLLAERGVSANARLGNFDVDAWESVLMGGAPPATAARPATATAGPAAGNEAADYLPDTFAVQADTLSLEGRTLHKVVIGGSRQGTVWRANMDAEELNGYAEYRPAAGDSGARLFARLARLKVPESATKEVETLLEEGRSADAGSALPALDIVVEDFELKSRRLGRLEIDAVHRSAAGGRQREWHLNKLNLSMPEATFAATGDWGRPAPSTGDAAQNRTLMNFTLDIRDSGQLLARFGMHDVIRRGAGRLQGQVGWTGSPFGPDYPSMSGQLNLNVETGQFLKADPGLAKLLSVLSLQSLPRRLTLDFRDVFSEGFAFDFVRGDVAIAQGVARTNNLQMKGVNAAVLMDGQADLEHETQNLRVVVVPEINAGTASLVAAVINPAVGLGTFLAQMFLRGPLTEAATQEFHITGAWADPKIDKLTGRQRLGHESN